MSIFQAVILGIVQGLAEFLPISSSGHLALVPWLLDWDDPGLAFDVALHWGTLVAVLMIFWREWVRLIGAALFGRGSASDRRIFWGLVVSAIPAGIAGKILEKFVEEHLRAPLLIAAALALLGIVLYIADRVGPKVRTLEEITLPRAFLIGLSQVAALVPGVSRSGATMTTGLFMGFTREEIARFSFLMSTPVIFGAGLLKFPEMVREMRSGESSLTWGALAAGFFASAIVGAAVIRWMLDYLRRRTYAAFSIYRLLAALAIVVVWMAGKR
ncbi:MAG: undecaprenyl-diphosphatase UppP [Deltaproteobacteria bacterium]|nr:MAG: undecaprenyl-diphosphatase UppP [Deltaproteobacteria bacterium]